MKPQDIFGIILRTAALYLSIWGAWNTLAGLNFLLPTIQGIMSGTALRVSAIDYWFYGIPAFFSGIAIFVFAESIVRISYPSLRPPELPKQVEPAKSNEA